MQEHSCTLLVVNRYRRILGDCYIKISKLLGKAYEMYKCEYSSTSKILAVSSFIHLTKNHMNATDVLYLIW